MSNETNQATHTPTPWEIWEGHTEIFGGVTTNTPGRMKSRYGCVARCEPLDREAETDEEAEAAAAANAEFIVRACNAHDDMLAALREADTHFTRFGPDPDSVEGFDEDDKPLAEAWRAIRAAIAKAG